MTIIHQKTVQGGINREHSKFVSRIWFRRTKVLPQRVKVGYSRLVRQSEGGGLSLSKPLPCTEQAALALMQDGHAGKNYDLTGSEGLDYWEVARIMSDVLGRTITYRNPNPFYFLIETVLRGTPFAFALIMMGLYTSTRFGMAEPITTNMKQLTERDPIPFKQYVCAGLSGCLALALHDNIFDCYVR